MHHVCLHSSNFAALQYLHSNFNYFKNPQNNKGVCNHFKNYQNN